MTATRPAPLAKVELPTAQIAKAALRRLALERLEPTPENYERAYRQEAGEPPADTTEALATLIERIIRGIERSGHNWTPARRKEGIQRVLAGGRGDAKKLQQRLSQLVNSWESDTAATPVALGDAAAAAVPTRPAPLDATAPAANAATVLAAGGRTAAAEDGASTGAWQRIALTLGHALKQALPAHDGANQDLARELAGLVERIEGKAAAATLADDVEALARRVERVLQHRHHLFDQLGKLCRELTASLTDLAEDGSWVKGQCEAMSAKIDEGPERARRARGQRHAAPRAQAPRRGPRRAREGARRAQAAHDADARRARRARLEDRQLPRERRPLRRRHRGVGFAREPDRRRARDGRREQGRAVARPADAGAAAGRAQQGDRPDAARGRARGRDEAALRRGLDRPADPDRQPARPDAGLRDRARAPRAQRRRALDRPARHRQLQEAQRRARPQRRRRGVEVARGGGEQDAQADRPRRPLRRRGVRRPAAGDAGGRGRAGADAAAAVAHRRPLHAQGQADLRHVLRRRDTVTAPKSGSRTRSSAPTRRSTKPSGPGRTAPASARPARVRRRRTWLWVRRAGRGRAGRRARTRTPSPRAPSTS